MLLCSSEYKKLCHLAVIAGHYSIGLTAVRNDQTLHCQVKMKPSPDFLKKTNGEFWMCTILHFSYSTFVQLHFFCAQAKLVGSSCLNISCKKKSVECRETLHATRQAKEGIVTFCFVLDFVCLKVSGVRFLESADWAYYYTILTPNAASI